MSRVLERRQETGDRKKQKTVKAFFYREEREGTRRKAKAKDGKAFFYIKCLFRMFRAFFRWQKVF